MISWNIHACKANVLLFHLTLFNPNEVTNNSYCTNWAVWHYVDLLTCLMSHGNTSQLIQFYIPKNQTLVYRSAGKHILQISLYPWNKFVCTKCFLNLETCICIKNMRVESQSKDSQRQHKPKQSWSSCSCAKRMPSPVIHSHSDHPGVEIFFHTHSYTIYLWPVCMFIFPLFCPLSIYTLALVL